jgi:mono/diheme cytochrome c family protein
MRSVRTALLASATLALTTLVLLAQGNPEAAKVPNPVAADAASIATGKQVYTRYCAVCHGITAEGGSGSDISPPAPDLTDKEWKHGSTDGEIFSVIKNGVPPDSRHGAVGRSHQGSGHLERRELRSVTVGTNRLSALALGFGLRALGFRLWTMTNRVRCAAILIVALQVTVSTQEASHRTLMRSIRTSKRSTKISIETRSSDSRRRRRRRSWPRD